MSTVYILSKFKIEALENNLDVFIVEDLIEVLQSKYSVIANSIEILGQMRLEYPSYKHTYELTLSRK